MRTIAACTFLKQRNEPSSVCSKGAQAILKRLNELHIKVLETKLIGRGITFLINEEDAQNKYRAYAERIQASKKKANKLDQQPDRDDTEGSRPSTTYRMRKDIRSIARAVLELYEMLGEEPHSRNAVRDIAQTTKETLQ